MARFSLSTQYHAINQRIDKPAKSNVKIQEYLLFSPVSAQLNPSYPSQTIVWLHHLTVFSRHFVFDFLKLNCGKLSCFYPKQEGLFFRYVYANQSTQLRSSLELLAPWLHRSTSRELSGQFSPL